MEIVISVSEAELEEFPEEAPESTGQQEQSRETSYAQGTVKCLLLVDTYPTPELLDRTQRGRVASMTGKSPKGGSDNSVVLLHCGCISLIPFIEFMNLEFGTTHQVHMC